tara:strand:- start:233 stop:397 length:165 start_codon:yes stop_codon:yes gene_type:complete
MKTVNTSRIVGIIAVVSTFVALVALVALQFSEVVTAGLFIFAAIGVVEATQDAE